MDILSTFHMCKKCSLSSPPPPLSLVIKTVLNLNTNLGGNDISLALSLWTHCCGRVYFFFSLVQASFYFQFRHL